MQKLLHPFNRQTVYLLIFARFVDLIKNNTSSLMVQDPNLDRMPPSVLLLIKIVFFADFDLKIITFWRQHASDSLNAKAVSTYFINQL